MQQKVTQNKQKKTRFFLTYNLSEPLIRNQWQMENHNIVLCC